MEQSRRQRIRTLVLNGSLGKMIRAVDAVLDAYTDQGDLIEDEAERVIKLGLLLMLTNYFDENDIVLLMDSSRLQLPKNLSESSQFEIRRLLSGKEDPDSPPGADTPGRLTLRHDDESDELVLEEKPSP